MISYYLRATDASAMDAALFEAMIVEASPFDGSFWALPNYRLIRLGELTVPDGQIPAASGEACATTIWKTLAGYHANLLSFEPLTDQQISRLPIIPKPKTPMVALG